MVKNLDFKILSTAMVLYFTGLSINSYKLAREVDYLKDEFHKSVFEFRNSGNVDSLDYKVKLEDINDKLKQFSLDNGACVDKWRVSSSGAIVNKAPLAVDPWYWFGSVDNSSLYK